MQLSSMQLTAFDLTIVTLPVYSKWNRELYYCSSTLPKLCWPTLKFLVSKISIWK